MERNWVVKIDITTTDENLPEQSRFESPLEDEQETLANFIREHVGDLETGGFEVKSVVVTITPKEIV